MKVAVVGLGIAGLSIAARLALAGHDVTGFEQFEPMHENGSSHGDTRIMRATPGEGEVYVRLARRAVDAWRTWEGLAGRPLIEWTGGLMAGPRGSPFVAACQRLSREPAALLRGDAIHPLTRGYLAMPYEWDVFRQEDAGVIAADATRAFLLRQAAKWGARLAHGKRIAAPIESTSFRIDGETFAFDAAIVAAGGWAGKLLPEFAGRLAVKRRVVGWFETETPRLLPVICIDNEEGVFGMPAPRGYYKLGLHAVGGETDPDHVHEPDERDAALLSEQAALLLPKHRAEPVRLQRCLYTVTPDENFLIAPSAAHERVLLFSACSGHGFKYAPVFGELAEEWLNGAPSAELEALGPHRRGNVNRLGAAKA
ncbi:MAG TPA: FAD-dependent oxidoreductase [Vitreimonas sp.]|uniref:FAD-dependent oxidoreductase n=1 Tax=Vitreimonas sp. TaxID=3069702 RepID=UPI002D2CC698|nr:FAD-dependent oxidoreductase [Vitreimonas sp.]HYD86973.1 FAD-dependent oxidoreductase [Vitreimonas sp.]